MSGIRSGIRYLVALVALTSVFLGAAKAPPAEQDPEPVRSMKASLSALADRDPEVREQARVKLMGLERRQLPTFQKVVVQARPLRPAQAVALREIVTHVYLAGEPYDANETQGFLGVRLQPTQLTHADGQIARPATMGVVIVDRMPGFAGARMLRDGDVILNIVELRDRLTLFTGDDFSMAVRELGPGRLIHFEILREGQVVRVPITLDPRPLEANGIFPVQELLNARRDKAETYWQTAFAPLLKEGVG